MFEADKTRHRTNYRYFTDFIQEPGTTAADETLVETNSTGSTSTQANDEQGKVGVVRLTTAGSATGRTALCSASAIIRPGGGIWFCETLVNVTTLSSGTQRFQFLAGFFDTLTAANQVDGCYFLYDEGGVSTSSTAAAYWQTCTCSNSSRTFNTSLSQQTVSAGSWVRLGVEINAGATSVSFYHNGTSVATHTATIPSGSGRQFGFGLFLIKSIGTTARTVDSDWFAVAGDFTSAR